jgi:uncharacterized protein (TIGR02271 family)
MRTVVGLFQDKNEARRTVEDLKRIGIREADVSMLSNEGLNGPISAYLDPATGAREPEAITRALVRMGLSDNEARRYVAGVQDGYTLETVAVDDARANDALEIMRSHAVGVGRRKEGQAAAEEGIQRDLRGAREGASEEVLPVIVEELAVGKREVEAGGVRVTSKVESTPVEQDVSLRTEKVDVERRKVDRPIGEADVGALKDREIEVIATAEEPVIEKKAKVVEEVVVTKDVDTRTEKIRDTVRRTDVDVQRIPFDAATYREHHASTYGKSGAKFEEYEPAYRYGHEMRTTRAADDWSSVEPEARTDWERKSPNSWERFKGAIKDAWERAKS